MNLPEYQSESITCLVHARLVLQKLLDDYSGVMFDEDNGLAIGVVERIERQLRALGHEETLPPGLPTLKPKKENP